MTTILYAETLYPDQSVEREVYGPDVRVIMHDLKPISELPDAECAEADALMVLDDWVKPEDYARFPKLKVVVRMGVGYDRINRSEAAKRGIKVCNVPDYGTTEVADAAMAMMLALRRGIILYHDTQRGNPPAPWAVIPSQVVKRLNVQRLGIVGLGRIGTAVALRAKAFGMDVVCYDPHKPMGHELGVGVKRVHSLDALFDGADAISVHAPLTPETRGLVGISQLRRLNKGSVLINTARGPIVDMGALETALREDILAGVGLDVIAVEPPVEPVPALLKAYWAREKWLEGRMIVCPHSAFHSPQAWADIRRKSAETVGSTLLAGVDRNVIPPEST